MSDSVANAYANTIKKHQRTYYGVWKPGTPIKLGDYGMMNGNTFVLMGNINDFDEFKGFELNIREDDTKDDMLFTSQEGVAFTLSPQVKANIEGVDVNASMNISFSREHGVFFNVAGCRIDSIVNVHMLGLELMKIHRNDKLRWRREFVLVSSVLSAERGLIVISTSSDFSLTFEAKAEVPYIDLAEVELDLTLTRRASAGEHYVTEEGFTPLVGLMKIQSKFLGPGRLSPLKESVAVPLDADIEDENLYVGTYTEDADA
jgi:hypothetical protein